MIRLLAFVALGLCLSAQQPQITQISNNYSYLVPGQPGYGIAEGSIFTIFGTNLANSSTDLQHAPLPATLAGVSANVVVNGVTTSPLWYYVTPGQIAGILPANTPAGTGTITITNNGQSSAPTPI